MKWVKRLLLSAVVFLLPLVILTGAVNLVARMPDFYQLEFNRTNVSKELMLSVNDTELAEFFSGFMRGKGESLVLELEDIDTGEPENIFLPEEQASMERFRSILNVLSLAGAVLVIPIVGGYYFLIRDGGKELVRRSFLFSLPVFAAYAAICACGLLQPETAAVLRDFLIGGAFPEENMLAGIFTGEFVLHAAIAVLAVAVIAYIIAGMVTWSITRPYRMFGRDRRDRI